MKAEEIKRYLHIPAEKDTPHRVAELAEVVRILTIELSLLQVKVIEMEIKYGKTETNMRTLWCRDTGRNQNPWIPMGQDCPKVD